MDKLGHRLVRRTAISLLYCVVSGFGFGVQGVALAMEEKNGEATQNGEATKNGEATQNGEATKNGEVGKNGEVSSGGEIIDTGVLRGFKFTLAPVRWSGNVSVARSQQNYDGGMTSVQNVQTAQMHASSYIWQPWLVQVAGGVGVVNGKHVSGENLSRNATLIGDGTLSLFPQSRFPFAANFNVTDTRTKSAAPTTEFVTRSMGLRQSYRTVSGAASSSASYNRTVDTINLPAPKDTVGKVLSLQQTYDSADWLRSRYSLGYNRSERSAAAVGYGDDAVSSLSGSYSARLGRQSLAANANVGESRWSVTDSRLNSNALGVRHSYRPEQSLLLLETSANIGRSAYRDPGDLGNSSYNTSNLQVGTSANWQPDEELPLYVNGGVRAYNASFDAINFANATSQSLSGNIGGRYAHTRNLNFTLDGSVTNASSNAGTSSRITTQSGGSSYTSDIVKLGDASYGWNGNGNLAYQGHTQGLSNRTISGGAGHNLGIPYVLDGGGSVNVSLSQSAMARHDRVSSQSQTLSNSGNVSWAPAPSETVSGSAILTVSDVRNFGGDNPSNFQAVTLGLNGLNQLSANSRNASLTANATTQWVSNGQGQYSTGTSARLAYNHKRAFGVNGLLYSLTLAANKSQATYAGNPLAKGSGSTVDQQMEYRIGRAFLRLNASYAKYSAVQSSSIFLYAGRSFGN